MQTTEYVVTNNGLEMRSIQQDPVSLSDAFFTSLGRYATLERRNTVEVPDWGMLHAKYHSEIDYYTLRLNRIPLRCAWAVNESSGLMTPDFSNERGSVEFELVWAPPEAMELYLLFSVGIVGDTQYSVDRQWLIAFRHGRPDAYRLPLANIHDDGKVCDDIEGTGRYRGSTPGRAILAALTKFAQSSWNADLWNSRQNTGYMFRFMAKDGKHEQQAPYGTWYNLCTLIAPEILGEVVRV